MPAPPPYVSHSAFSDTLRRPTTGFDSSTAPTKKRIGSTRKSSVRTVNKKKRIKGERGKERIFRDCIGMGTQSGVCDARCLNYTETWLGGSFFLFIKREGAENCRRFESPRNEQKYHRFGQAGELAKCEGEAWWVRSF